MTAIRTTCPYCGVGCGILAKADGTIQGDPDHPANFGRLCSKGSALGDTLDLKGRLLQPQIAGENASWDAALDLVAHKFQTAIQKYGPDSVAFYVSGQLLTEDYYVANKLMKGFIGSANIDTNSRLCMASSVAGHRRAFGADTVPGTYADLEQADLIVLVGSNLAWCHPVLHQRILAAKAARPNLRIINIDPRKTATTALADDHLQIAPDGDIALFNGLLAYLAESGSIDHAYLQSHVSGFDEAVAQARISNPADSGLSHNELMQFYQTWARTEKVVTVYSQGVNQSKCGTDKVNAILNCHLATGRIGKLGSGPFSVTGQPNAMGGREVGGLANTLANHLDIENPEHRQTVQGFWSSPTISSKPGLKAVDLFQACADGKIKALWIMSTNPAVSLPDVNRVSDAIKNTPFVAVSDIMARTDTGDLADVLLPATGWGEKEGSVTNSERRISRQRAFLPAPRKARPDWQIICDVASRMGWAEAFAYTSPAEIFAEYVALSKVTRKHGLDLDLSNFEGLDYETLLPTQWPASETRFFANGGFYHPDGKARMLAIKAPVQQEQTGFTLNTGRNRDQWHTMTRTGKAPLLGAHLAEPYAELHPRDAEEIGVTHGDILHVGNTQGRALLRALISDKVARSQLFAPMHWTRQQSSAGMANLLTAPEVDPISGQPALKSGGVTARRFEAKWYAFAASLYEMQPFGDYAAIARTPTGWQGEFAGNTSPKDWSEFASSLFQTPDGTAAVSRDLANQKVSVALYRRHRLVGLLFVGPCPMVLARTHAISAIGSEVSALHSLAVRDPIGQSNPGPTICACMNVGINTVQKAVSAGACSLETIGELTGAGTSCGSCKPELATLIQRPKVATAAK